MHQARLRRRQPRCNEVSVASFIGHFLLCRKKTTCFILFLWMFTQSEKRMVFGCAHQDTRHSIFRYSCCNQRKKCRFGRGAVHETQCDYEGKTKQTASDMIFSNHGTNTALHCMWPSPLGYKWECCNLPLIHPAYSFHFENS